MRTLRITLISMLIMGSASTTFGAKDAGVSSPFILGAGARASGMGKAFVSIADDASAVYWNPAGLARVSQKEVAFLHTNLFFSATYDFVGYVHPTPRTGAFGIGILRLAVDDIESRDENNILIDTLKNGQAEYIISYGRAFSPSLSTGFNIKMDTQKIGQYSAKGIGLDLGMLVEPSEKALLVRKPILRR